MLGKDFGERVSVSLNALNVANRRVELDNSVTFGGFHWNNPREIFARFGCATGSTIRPVPRLEWRRHEFLPPQGIPANRTPAVPACF